MQTIPSPAKTHYKLLVNPNYIGAYVLMDDNEKSHDLVVKITQVGIENVQNGDKKEEAFVIHLNGQKPMIVNSTNRKSIALAAGSEFIEDWIGKSITLYVAKVNAFGEWHHALRVRTAAPKPPDLIPGTSRWDKAITALKKGNATIQALQEKNTITPNNLKLLQDATTE